MSALRYVLWTALLLAVVLGVVVAAVVAAPALRRGDRREGAVRAARALLAGAVLAVLVVTVAEGRGDTGSPLALNLVPGNGIRTALRNADPDLGLLNLVGNVVMFVPVGLFLPLATGARRRTVVVWCVALSVCVEMVQLLIGRAFDVDDILLNTVGGVVGALLGGVLVALVPGPRRPG